MQRAARSLDACSSRARAVRQRSRGSSPTTSSQIRSAARRIDCSARQASSQALWFDSCCHCSSKAINASRSSGDSANAGVAPFGEAGFNASSPNSRFAFAGAAVRGAPRVLAAEGLGLDFSRLGFGSAWDARSCQLSSLAGAPAGDPGWTTADSDPSAGLGVSSGASVTAIGGGFPCADDGTLEVPARSLDCVAHPAVKARVRRPQAQLCIRKSSFIGRFLEWWMVRARQHRWRVAVRSPRRWA